MIGTARPLSAALLLMVCFGSIHAFSLFLVSLERATGAPRAAVSLVYGLALAALTVAVLGTRLLLARHSPARLAVGACLVGATGLAIASVAPPLLLVQLGYGLLFGAANGLAYVVCLVVAGSVVPARAGFWLGSVTAAYALGAALAALVLGAALPALGWRMCLIVLAGAFVLLGAASGLLLHGLHLPTQRVPEGGRTPGDLPRFWVAYGASVAAGLMVLGHAAAIVQQSAGPPSNGALATMLAGLANAAGGLAAGLANDRLPTRRLLACISALSSAGLALLLAGEALAGVILVAFAYGAHIASFPAAVRDAFGADAFAWAYARVFTAWGAVGLAAPWLAGLLHAHGRGYMPAFVLASGMAAIGLACNVGLPSRREPGYGRAPGWRTR